MVRTPLKGRVKAVYRASETKRDTTRMRSTGGFKSPAMWGERGRYVEGKGRMHAKF